MAKYLSHKTSTDLLLDLHYINNLTPIDSELASSYFEDYWIVQTKQKTDETVGFLKNLIKQHIQYPDLNDLQKEAIEAYLRIS